MRHVLPVAVGCLCTLAGPLALGSVYSDAFLGHGSYAGLDLVDNGYSDTGQFVSAGGSVTFEPGLYQDGATTFSGSAQASAMYGVLKASASGQVTNAYMPDLSEDYPEILSVGAQTNFVDTLQHGSTAVNYTSKYYFNLTGNIFGEGYVVFDIQHGNEPREQHTFFASGSYNETIVTEAYVHGAFPQTIDVSLRAFVEFNTDYFYETGATLSGSANFFSTAVLEGIEVRDADSGLLIEADSIMGDSGTSYTVGEAPVIPEPGSLAVLGLLGVACLGRGASRRR